MKEWLSGIVGESTANILGFVLIFALILGAIFVLLAIVRRFGGGGFTQSNRTRQPRLSVMDAAAVDSRRKLVLIRRDDVEHLLLIGGPTDVVVEQNIVLQSRAHSLSPQSKIEPEHVELFRQREASISVEKPSPSLSAPEKSPEPKEIQLNSAVENRQYNKPAAVEARPSEPAFQQARPTPPVAPTGQAAPAPQQGTSVRREPQMAMPSTPPQPRPAPGYPPQPRTVQPARDVANKPTTRAHPPYPLSQVSRGVVAATSTAAATAAAAAGTAAFQPKPAPAAIDEVSPPSPKPEPDAAPAVNFASSKEHTVEPQVDVNPVEPVIATDSKQEPVLVVEEETVETVSVEQVIGSDIEDALNDAILADLETKKPAVETAKEAAEAFTLDSLEDELLTSLDITPDGGDVKSKSSEASIEDEMAKLLGELSNDERPKR